MSEAATLLIASAAAGTFGLASVQQEVLFVPAGTIHAVNNVASGNGAELATYVVEKKGKPLITLATNTSFREVELLRPLCPRC